MRVLLAFALLAALGACSTGAAQPSEPTVLTITYWPTGPAAGGKKVWTLRCGPARGTLPRPATACRRLAAGGTRLLAAPSKSQLCTQIYGGPEVARVVGRVRGAPVRVTFTRTDGCQISRWNALSPWLLPAGGS
jgi:hypothetical protein